MYIGSFSLKSVRAPSGAQCYFSGDTENKAHIALLAELTDVFLALDTINISPATGR
jgi:hypothetical protein